MAKKVTIAEYELPIDTIIEAGGQTAEGKVAVVLGYGQVHLRLLLTPRDAQRMSKDLSATTVDGPTNRTDNAAPVAPHR